MIPLTFAFIFTTTNNVCIFPFFLNSLRSLTDLLTSISGIKIKNITKNTFTIEFRDIYEPELPANCDTATDRSILLLTLQFADVDGQCVVEDVKVC